MTTGSFLSGFPIQQDHGLFLSFSTSDLHQTTLRPLQLLQVQLLSQNLDWQKSNTLCLHRVFLLNEISTLFTVLSKMILTCHVFNSGDLWRDRNNTLGSVVSMTTMVVLSPYRQLLDFLRILSRSKSLKHLPHILWCSHKSSESKFSLLK